MPKITNLTKKWGNKPVFDGFSLKIAENKITAILGKSGQGKSTLLSCISNLTSYEGKIEGFGNLSYVFQEHRLIESLTVKQNLEYVLEGALKDKSAVNEVIDRVLALTELKHLKNKQVKTLSGGEKQRVTLARAFAYPSNSILLDEPFNSLDLGLKNRIMADFRKLFETFPKTCVFVSHSVDEVLFLSDDIYFLHSNKAEYVGSVFGERKYGYEKDGTIRRKLYKLLFNE